MTDPSSEGRVGVAMIGTGFMARSHSACLRLDERVRLAHVASRREEAARTFAHDYGYASAGADWRAILDDPSVDLVDITAPNAAHADMAVAAAQAGKHFVLEKPIATTLEDADRIVTAVREAGVLGLYHENRRFAPVLLEARRHLDAGALGRLHTIRVNELGSGPTHADWFRDPAAAGGGAMIDLGVHGLFVLEWLMGEPVVEVQATARWEQDQVLDETMSVSYRFASGAVAQSMSSWAALGGMDLRTELFGDGGTLLLDQSRSLGGMRLYRDEEGDAASGEPHRAAGVGWTYPPVEPLRARGTLDAMRHFVDCALGARPARCTVEEGRRVVELTEAVYRSARERTAVPVPDASAIVARERRAGAEAPS